MPFDPRSRRLSANAPARLNGRVVARRRFRRRRLPAAKSSGAAAARAVFVGGCCVVGGGDCRSRVAPFARENSDDWRFWIGGFYCVLPSDFRGRIGARTTACARFCRRICDGKILSSKGESTAWRRSTATPRASILRSTNSSRRPARSPLLRRAFRIARMPARFDWARSATARVCG